MGLQRISSPPDKTTWTKLFLELNNILKDNATLEDVTIQSESAQYLEDVIIQLNPHYNLPTAITSTRLTKTSKSTQTSAHLPQCLNLQQ